MGRHCAALIYLSIFVILHNRKIVVESAQFMTSVYLGDQCVNKLG